MIKVMGFVPNSENQEWQCSHIVPACKLEENAFFGELRYQGLGLS